MGERWIIWFVCLADISELENVECKNHLLLRLSFSFSQPFFLRVQVTAWSLKKTPALQAIWFDKSCLSLPSPWRKWRALHFDTSILIPEVCSKIQMWLSRLLHDLEDLHGFRETSGQNKSRDICRENSCLEKIQAKNKGKTFHARLSS